MISNKTKELINLAILKLELENPTKTIITEAEDYLKKAIEQIKSENTMVTTPVTQEELLPKFPVEPEYPELQLVDYNIEINLKEDLLSLEVEEGTVVKTKGYYEINDGGQACYKIMTYENWYNELPIDLKMVTYHNDRIGCNAVYYKNPVDNFGNHRLNNGMVAKLLPNKDGFVRVEQWGCFEGRMDNCRALVHCFANNLRNSKILFKKEAKYVFYNSYKTEVKDRIDSIIKNIPWWLNRNGICSNGNEYALIHHTRTTAFPVIGDAQNLELCGNNCSIKLGNGQMCGFSMIGMGGYIDGLKIHGFNFDGNFREQVYELNPDGSYPTNEAGEEVYNTLPPHGHGLSYFTTGFNVNALQVDSNGNAKDGNGEIFGEGITREVILNYGNFEDYGNTHFNNVEIYGNTFKDLGSGRNIPDNGGDCILIINPTYSKNVNIHNNKMLNWGRWTFAVDLGGNGERFYNYTFKQNLCIQDENNYLGQDTEDGTHTGYRGLGFIDFEARKCFTNLEVSENYVYGANGWAFNGNGKISENIKIERNYLYRPAYTWRSIYPYSFTFYSVYPKDLIFKANEINAGSCGLGNIHNLEISNNKFTGTGTVSFNMTGKCIIKHNEGEGTRGQLFQLNSSYSTWLTTETSEFFIPKEERKTDILFKNNKGGGVCGTLINTGDPKYYNNTSVIFEGNMFNKFSVNTYGLKEFRFDDSQLIKQQANGNPIVYVARGMKATKPSFCYGYSMVVGGLHFNAEDKLINSFNGMGRNIMKYFTTDLPYSDYITRGELYCIEEGYVPISGEFLVTNADNYWTANSKCSRDTFYIHNDNVYYCDKDGTFGDVPPTHMHGTVENGNSRLMFFDKLAKIEIRGLEGKYMDNQYYNDDSNLRGAGGCCTKILFDEVESNTKYKITAIEETTKTIITYFNEANIAIKTERAETKVMEFTTPENCTKIRVGFVTSNKQEAINGYKIEKIV